MSLIKIENAYKKSQEHYMIQKISKKNFNLELKKYGFDPRVFLYKRILTKSNINKFNNMLIVMKHNLHIDIYQMLLYIEEDYTSIKILRQIINDEIKDIIKSEMESMI